MLQSPQSQTRELDRLLDAEQQERDDRRGIEVREASVLTAFILTLTILGAAATQVNIRKSLGGDVFAAISILVSLAALLLLTRGFFPFPSTDDEKREMKSGSRREQIERWFEGLRKGCRRRCALSRDRSSGSYRAPTNEGARHPGWQRAATHQPSNCNSLAHRSARGARLGRDWIGLDRAAYERRRS